MQVSPQALPVVQTLQQMRIVGRAVGAVTRTRVQVGDGRSIGSGVHVWVRTGMRVNVGNGFVAAGDGVRKRAVAVSVMVGVNVFVGEGATVMVEVGKGISATVG